MQLFSKYLLDQMVYVKTPKPKHAKRLAAPEDYTILGVTAFDAPVWAPPANSSTETIAELEHIAASQGLHVDPAGLEQKYDDSFEWAFAKCLEKAGLEWDEVWFKQLIDEAASITIRLKYRFNRPRPFQLGPKLGIDVCKEQSSTAKTPSYPSGHSAQSRLVALVLAKQYPELEKKLIKIADEISLSRLVGGHHFPSDIEYGEFLGKWMADNIK